MEISTPIPRIYDHEKDRALVDNFYDIVETIYKLVFVQRVRRSTGENYFFNPSITNIQLIPIRKGGNTVSIYAFEFDYDRTERTFAGKIRVRLLSFARTTDSFMIVDNEIFFSEDFSQTLRFPWRDFILRSRDYFIDAFSIWISVPRLQRRDTVFNAFFKKKLEKYEKLLRKREMFIHQQIPAFSHILIPNHGPSHAQSPYLAETLSNELVFQTIQRMGIEDCDAAIRQLYS
jgi:hypothetical protein